MDLSIGQAAKRLKVSTKTLREWDKSGRLKAHRNKNNYRIYDELEVNRLAQTLGRTDLNLNDNDKNALNELIKGHELAIIKVFEADFIKRFELDYIEPKYKSLDNLFVALSKYVCMTNIMSSMYLFAKADKYSLIQKTLSDIEYFDGIVNTIEKERNELKNYEYSSNIEQIVFGDTVGQLSQSLLQLKHKPELVDVIDKYAKLRD